MPPAHRRELTTLERHALKWLLLHEKPERLGTLLAGLRRQGLEWLLSEDAAFDSPYSPRQWDRLLSVFEGRIRSQVYQAKLRELKSSLR